MAAAIWVKDTLGTKITGSNGDSRGNLSFETVDISFNDMVSTIVSVKNELGNNMEWYNWEIEVV